MGAAVKRASVFCFNAVDHKIFINDVKLSLSRFVTAQLFANPSRHSGEKTLIQSLLHFCLNFSTPRGFDSFVSSPPVLRGDNQERKVEMG